MVQKIEKSDLCDSMNYGGPFISRYKDVTATSIRRRSGSPMYSIGVQPIGLEVTERSRPISPSPGRGMSVKQVTGERCEGQRQPTRFGHINFQRLPFRLDFSIHVAMSCPTERKGWEAPKAGVAQLRGSREAGGTGFASHLTRQVPNSPRSTMGTLDEETAI